MKKELEALLATVDRDLEPELAQSIKEAIINISYDFSLN